MSRLARAIIVLSLAVISIASLGCTKQPTLLEEYELEMERARNVAYSAMEQLDEVGPGLKLRKRLNEINVIHANTLKFIDANPKYSELHSRLWSDGRPPSLAWAIPQDGSEEHSYLEYLEDYIAMHDWAIDRLEEE